MFQILIIVGYDNSLVLVIVILLVDTKRECRSEMEQSEQSRFAQACLLCFVPAARANLTLCALQTEAPEQRARYTKKGAPQSWPAVGV